MKKYWKSILSFTGIVCAALTVITALVTQSSVVNAAGTEGIASVDPLNAILATVIAGVVGIAVFIKRHITG